MKHARKKEKTSTYFFSSMEVAIFVNDELVKSLQRLVYLQQFDYKTTLSIFGGVRLQKWDRLVLKMKSTNNQDVVVSEKTTLGMVLTGWFDY